MIFFQAGTPYNDSFNLFHRVVDFALFTCLLPVPCFPRVALCLMFSRAWQWLQSFPHFAMAVAVMFPALGNRCTFFSFGNDWMFFHVWRCGYLFPCLAMGVIFSALGKRCMIVFLCLAVFGNWCNFSRELMFSHPWRWLCVFLALGSRFMYFPALGSGWIFLRTWPYAYVFLAIIQVFQRSATLLKPQC